MATFFVQAQYSQIKEMARYLVGQFGDGQVKIKETRDRVQVTVPQSLTPVQEKEMLGQTNIQHYEQY